MTISQRDTQTQAFIDRMEVLRENADERTLLATRIVRTVVECGNANDAILAVARILKDHDDDLREVGGKDAE